MYTGLDTLATSPVRVVPITVSVWILGLLEEDLEPLLEILEETNEVKWRAIERNWIKQCRKYGLELVNLCKGGEGGAYEGHEVSEVTRQKMRNPWADPEWRAKMMEARRKSTKPKGWQAMSEEQRRAFREKRKTWAPMKGRKFTEEHKARIGAANAVALEGRKVSPEFRKHLAKIGQERWTCPHERERASERSKKAKRNEKGQFIKS